MRRRQFVHLAVVAAVLTLTACQPEEGGRILLKSPEVDGSTEVGYVSIPIRDHPDDPGFVIWVPNPGGTQQQPFAPADIRLCLDLAHAVFREPGVGNPIVGGNDKYELTADDPCLENGIVLTLHRKHP